MFSKMTQIFSHPHPSSQSLFRRILWARWITICSLLLLITPQAEAQTSVTNGLVAYYPFIDSVNGTDASPSITWDIPPYWDSTTGGLLFNDTNQSFSITATNVAFSARSSFSVSVFLKASSQHNEFFFHTSSFYISLTGDNRVQVWSVSDGVNTPLNSVIITNAHSYTVSFDVPALNATKGLASIFVDGVLISQKLLPVQTTDDEHITVGWPQDGHPGYGGLMRSLKLYNRALSLEESQSIAIEDALFNAITPYDRLNSGLYANYPLHGDYEDKAGTNLTLDDLFNPGTPGYLVTDRFGEPESAYQTSGSSTTGWTSLRNNAFTFPTPDFTVSAWWRTEPFNIGAHNAGRIIDDDDGDPLATGNKGAIVIDVRGNGLPTNNVIGATIGTGNSFVGGITATNPTDISLWHHSVVTVSGTTAFMYLDGRKVGSAILSQPIVSGVRLLYLAGRGWPGAANDFRIYNRGLSAGEVAALYNLESTFPNEPRLATLEANITNGFIVSFNVIDAGTGYSTNPVIVIQGGGGSGASAVAMVTNGHIASVTVLNPGRNYSSSPTILVDAPPHPQRQAQAQAELAGPFVVAATVSDHGAGYTNTPQVYILGGGGAGATAEALLFNGSVAEVNIVDPGIGYTSTPTVIVEPPPGYPPSKPTATATVVNGEVTMISLTSIGTGYGTNVPPVSIIGGGGAGATATAVVQNGLVVGILVTGAGSGYSSTPTVIIGDPAGKASLSLEISQVQVFLNLVYGYTYKLITTVDGGITWTDTGAPFLATSTNMTKLVNVSSRFQLFRTVQVP